jgi:hypothetical protein
MTNRPMASKAKASCENASIMVMVGFRKRPRVGLDGNEGTSTGPRTA